MQFNICRQWRGSLFLVLLCLPCYGRLNGLNRPRRDLVSSSHRLQEGDVRSSDLLGFAMFPQRPVGNFAKGWKVKKPFEWLFNRSSWSCPIFGRKKERLSTDVCRTSWIHTRVAHQLVGARALLSEKHFGPTWPGVLKSEAWTFFGKWSNPEPHSFCCLYHQYVTFPLVLAISP